MTGFSPNSLTQARRYLETGPARPLTRTSTRASARAGFRVTGAAVYLDPNDRVWTPLPRPPTLAASSTSWCSTRARTCTVHGLTRSKPPSGVRTAKLCKTRELDARMVRARTLAADANVNPPADAARRTTLSLSSGWAVVHFRVPYLAHQDMEDRDLIRPRRGHRFESA